MAHPAVRARRSHALTTASSSSLAPAAVARGLGSPSVPNAGKSRAGRCIPAPHSPWQEMALQGTHPNIHLHHFVQRNPYNLHPKVMGCFVKCSMGTLGGHTKRRGRNDIHLKAGFEGQPAAHVYPQEQTSDSFSLHFYKRLYCFSFEPQTKRGQPNDLLQKSPCDLGNPK